MSSVIFFIQDDKDSLINDIIVCKNTLTDFETNRLHQRKYRFCHTCRRANYVMRIECFQCRKYAKECTFTKSICHNCRRLNTNRVRVKISARHRKIVLCVWCNNSFDRKESGHRLYCSAKCASLRLKELRNLRQKEISGDKNYVI